MTMTAPSSELVGLPWGRPLTYEDFEALRESVDDGHRYELIDGVLIVSPSPIHVHQRAVGNLHVALRATVLDELKVLLAPFDVVFLGETATVMQPDLLVAARGDIMRRNLPSAPLLAIEVLSPSTRSFDLHLKKDRLRRAGCAHYWVADPAAPSIVAWRLVGQGDDAEYELVGEAVDDEVLHVLEPFAITVTPRALVER